MTRPRDSGTNRHRINQVGGRASNLERRFVEGANLSVASIRSSSGGFTVSHHGDGHHDVLSLEDGVTGHFQTNDDTVFANASGPLGVSGATVWGVQILQEGLYRFDWDAVVAGGTAGAQITVYQTTEDGIPSAFLSGRTISLIGDDWDINVIGPHLFWTEFTGFSNVQVPSITVPWADLASGSDCSVGVALFVTRLNDFDFDNI